MSHCQLRVVVATSVAAMSRCSWVLLIAHLAQRLGVPILGKNTDVLNRVPPVGPAGTGGSPPVMPRRER